MQTIPDSETPIFQEINAELGELPEIDVHDFTEHAFGFLNDGNEAAAAQPEPTTADGPTTNGGEQAEQHAEAEPDLAEEPGEQTAGEEEPASDDSAPRKGGRRRKEGR